jgi:hypothetical protein
MVIITLTQDSYRIMGNVKYDDDRINAMQDSYNIMGNVTYG